MSSPRYVATFTPQAWVRDYAITVDAAGPTEWDCTDELRELDTIAGLRIIASGHDIDDLLKADPNAPEWVHNWTGPFEIHVREAVVGDGSSIEADPMSAQRRGL